MWECRVVVIVMDCPGWADQRLQFMNYIAMRCRCHGRRYLFIGWCMTHWCPHTKTSLRINILLLIFNPFLFRWPCHSFKCFLLATTRTKLRLKSVTWNIKSSKTIRHLEAMQSCSQHFGLPDPSRNETRLNSEDLGNDLHLCFRIF